MSYEDIEHHKAQIAIHKHIYMHTKIGKFCVKYKVFPDYFSSLYYIFMTFTTIHYTVFKKNSIFADEKITAYNA